MQDIYMLTAVDVRRAEQNDTSRALIIEKLTLPAIKFAEAEHNPGGGVGQVGFILPRIEKVEPAFMVRGIDTDAFNGMGVSSRWTFAGAYRNKKTGAVVPGRGIIEGAIRTWEPDESSPTDFQGCNYAFAEVTHYEFLLNGEEKWYWDFWEREIRRDGIDYFADERAALGA